MEATMKPALIASTMAVIALVGWFLFPAVFPEVEAPRKRGPLTEALFKAANTSPPVGSVTDIYNRFIKPEMSLAERAAFLRANGFGCKIERADTQNSNDTQLRCIRTMEGSWGCRGWGFFAFQAQDGRILRSGGSPFEVDPLFRKDNRCASNLREQAELDAQER